MTNFKEAVIAVTLNCNARCAMCNIWQNRIKGEVSPDIYKKLPHTLREINITGGEPFLRSDLPEIVRIMKKTCPQARLLINTNGYLTGQIKKVFPEIMQMDPHISMRVSIDAYGDMHSKIRGLPYFFEHALKTLEYFKEAGVKDLGISYTLMERNKYEMLKLFEYCNKNDLEFSVTAASDSPIYFGNGKVSLRPKNDDELHRLFKALLKKQFSSTKPKDWVRAWFNLRLEKYLDSHTRYYSCDAGRAFFYMDSLGRIYTCHLKPWFVGDLRIKTFDELAFNKFSRKVDVCNECWMVCSARSAIKKRLFPVLTDILLEKIKILTQR